MNKRTAFVAGASGLTGRELTRLLCDHPAFETVKAAVRTSLKNRHPKLVEEILDFESMEQNLDLTGVTDVFCALGTTIRIAGSQEAFRRVDLEYPVALARVAERFRVQHFCLISSVGADSASGNFYLRTKGEAEAAVTGAFSGSVSILRPSLLLGERKEFRPGERIGAVVMKALTFLMIGPFRKYRPIRASKVAAAMIAAALQDRRGRRIYQAHELEMLAASRRNPAA